MRPRADFSLYGLNFSLFLRGRANFSLFGLNFSLLATFPVKFSLFHRISHSSSRPHSHAGRPNLTPAGPFRVAGQPSPTPALPMTWLIPCYRWAGARRQITVRHAGVHRSTCRRAKSEKFRVTVCEKWEIQTKSEKFVKLRSSKKWEIRASAQEKWEIQTKSEKFKHKSENQIINLFVKVRNSRE